MTFLLESNVDLYEEDYEGLTALGVAAKVGSLATAKVLLEWHRRTGRQKSFKGGCIDGRNSRDTRGKTLLHLAAESDDADVARILIDNGADMEAEDPDGNSCLYLALTQKSYNVARCLIYSGADVNRHSADDDFTPLHRVAADGEPRLLRVLLGRGAEVNALAKNSQTPLHIALYNVARNYSDIEAVRKCCQILIENGADLEAKDDLGISVREHPWMRHLIAERPGLVQPKSLT